MSLALYQPREIRIDEIGGASAPLESAVVAGLIEKVGLIYQVIVRAQRISG